MIQNNRNDFVIVPTARRSFFFGLFSSFFDETSFSHYHNHKIKYKV
tara:strand:- start:3430 stop:3567 length:138 start_codon:yes stop_codon:yes gene_type:complete